MGARYRHNELEGEGAVAFSIFCWLRRTGELKLCPSAAPSESDIRVPARVLSAAEQGGAERPGAAGSPAGAEEVHSLPTRWASKTTEMKEPLHEEIVWGLFAVHSAS